MQIQPKLKESWLLELDDLDKYKEQISVMCLKKCLNDPDEPSLNSAQRVCLSRCAYKVFSSVNYMNKVYGNLELKVNKFQEAKFAEQNSNNN